MSLLCIFLICCVMQHYASSLGNAGNPWRKPYCSRTCQGNGGRNQTGIVSKYHCSCSPSCKIYEDCCYDSRYKNREYLEEFDFLCLYVDGRAAVQAVSSCPPNVLSDFCESAITHLPPVTSKRTNTTYANAFCAQCNSDADSLVTWNVELRCCSEYPHMRDSLLSNDLSTYFQDNYIWAKDENNTLNCFCKYHVHYANYTLIDSLELRFCGKEDRISGCPLSYAGSVAERMCWTYEDPVYVDSAAFRNHYCAGCHGFRSLEQLQCWPSFVDDPLWRDYANVYSRIYMCNKLGLTSCFEYLTGTKKGRPQSISSMFRKQRPNESAKSEVKQSCIPPPEGKCCTTGMYDHISNSCRKARKRKTQSKTKTRN